MTNSEEQALKDFLVDTDNLRKLDDWKDSFNLFDILKVADQEIRHSNILAWFFNPNENHGLGDSFIKLFMNQLVSKCNSEKYDILNLLLQDFYSYQVYRELHHMDIVLISQEENTVIIIENKTLQKESPNQLKKYFEKSKSEYKDFKNIFHVFLTPDGDEASNTGNWISFSYEDIIDILESSIKGISLRDDVLLLTQNYIDIVRKKIMKEKDEKLVQVCNDIYNKHKTALQLIFENVKMDTSIVNEIICETLRELDKDEKIIYYDDNRWHFFTKEMNEYLPALDNTNSSWDTNWVYYYWFADHGDRLTIHFEIGGWNLTDELTKRMNALIEVSNKRQGEYRYKRLYFKRANLSMCDTDDYEESVKNAVKTLVNSALNNEKKLLEAAKEILNESK